MQNRDLTDLQAFLVVARERSFTRAAATAYQARCEGHDRGGAVSEPSSASISSNRGPTVPSRRWAAEVGATLRVVRDSSLTPSLSSNSRTVD
jgi:hypothetical protein